MQENFEKFIQKNSPDGGFLQSSEWQKFQESVGRKTYHLSHDGFWANIIEHKLPIVGKYFYVPRGPVAEIRNSKIKKGIEELIDLARKEKVGWVRVDPATDDIAEEIKNIVGNKNFCSVRKAPHDMQPKEVFVIDITKSEEEILAQMKSKTRYNIKLAEKRGVFVKAISNFKFQISNQIQNSNDQNQNEKYIAEFLRLVKVTAKRDGIVSHPESHYRKMLEIIPSENLKLYVAEYEEKVIAANLVSFYGETCTYMHGASDNENRNVMAPFLLQWQQIQDAKKAGCTKYDFGGVMTENPKSEIRNLKQAQKSNDQNLKQNILDIKYQIQDTKWAGITRFKIGFSPETVPTRFPGTYDIIIDKKRYLLYKFLGWIKKAV